MADADSSDTAQWTRIEFQRQVEPHIPRLYRLCLILSRDAAEAEDLLQNSLVKAYIHRATFARRGSLVSWLYGIVRHEHSEIVRTHARRRSLLAVALEKCSDVLNGVAGDHSFSTTPEDTAIVNQEAGALLSCLRELNEPYRTTVLLCDIEELTYEEAAASMKVPVGTAKSRHARGRVKLKQAYERLCKRQRITQERPDEE